MNRGAGTRRQERRRYNPVSSNEGDVEPQQQGESLNPMEEGRLVPTNATTTTTTTTTGMEVVSAGAAAAGNSNNRRPRGRQQYSRISSSWEEPDDEEEQEEEERVMLQQDSNNNMNNTSEHSGIAGSTTSTTTITTMENNQVNNIDDDDDDDDDANKFTVTILDFAQKKFQITGVSPSWTVRQLKQAGAKIHKVVPARQRLIFRGKMLDDGDGDSNDNDDSKTTKTLKDYGITEDGIIVHLFPKPRVVITNSAANTRERDEEEQAAAADDDDDDDEDEEDNDGARVPTIIMDAAEAERRSQILVLGSTDFIEAQNNVKLFSFMLLIISSIELLNLFGIAMGVPQDAAAENTHGFPVSEDDYNVPIVPEDDFFSPDSGSGSSGGDMSNHTGGFSEDNDPVTAYLSHWGPAQWADTLVSLVGVYVALLGLRASTSNTLRLARTYFTALIGVGIGWLLYNFFQTVELEHKFEEKKQEQREENNSSNNNLGPPLSESDIYNQAFQVMLLPALVWFMCWMRAWQFQQLLHEAEAEAEARIQTQLHLEEQEAELSLSSTTSNNDDDNNNNNSNSNTTTTTTTRHLPNHDEEMALNNSNAVLT